MEAPFVNVPVRNAVKRKRKIGNWKQYGCTIRKNYAYICDFSQHTEFQIKEVRAPENPPNKYLKF